MKTSKKLREVFDRVIPHINGHKTVIEQFTEVIYELEEIEKLNIDPPSNVISSHTCDAIITKYVDTLDVPEGQDRYIHDTAFIKGAIWMRERIADMLEVDRIEKDEYLKEKQKNKKSLLSAMYEAHRYRKIR